MFEEFFHYFQGSVPQKEKTEPITASYIRNLKLSQSIDLYFLLINAQSVLCLIVEFPQVLDEYMPDYKLSVETYCALTLVPLVIICQIRNLKWLVPFSAIANVFLVICFAITMYYIFTGLPNPKEREMVAPVTQWPLFIR